jgi:hypothetical protein
MGFLDHSTNNIIVDAVLTEKGRQMLASNNFVIDSYAFGDDEVDYSLLVKYGVAVGKEKIQKNTPIFEAGTNSEGTIKSFLFTNSNIGSTVGSIDLVKNDLTVTVTRNENQNLGEFFVLYDPTKLQLESSSNATISSYDYNGEQRNSAAYNETNSTSTIEFTAVDGASGTSTVVVRDALTLDRKSITLEVGA